MRAGVDLANLLAFDARGAKSASGARRCDEREPEARDGAGDRRDVALVAIVHRDEYFPTPRRLVVDRELGLSECCGEVARDAHDLTGRFHLGAEHDVGAREAAERHDGFLHAEVIELAVVGGKVQIGELLPCHDAGRDLR